MKAIPPVIHSHSITFILTTILTTILNQLTLSQPTPALFSPGLCTTSPCSAADLSDANTIITDGCASDIQSGQLIPVGLQLVVQNFNGIKSLLCTQQSSNSSYCVPEILYAAQNASNTQFSLSTLSGLASNQNGAESLLSSIPPSVYCTDCGEAITIEGGCRPSTSVLFIFIADRPVFPSP